MRLFIRDHLPLILIQIIQLMLVLLIYWLDGYRNAPTAFYSIFVGLFLLSLYLIYRYMSHRAMYRRLSEPLQTLDESIQSIGYAPMSEAVQVLLEIQYRHYQTQLKAGEKKREDHLTFINQWVHQMKTPLAVIHLIAQDEEDDRFASIREEADRMEKGLETVLYAARLDVFEHDFRVEQVSLKRIAQQSVHENKRAFIRNKVYPELIMDQEFTVESDAKWLLFVLGQLVTNAIKYSAGNQLKVTISAWRDNEEIILEVRDRGIGIPKQDLKRVFQPFFTGENGRINRESTGMGLYLAEQFCRRLGHRIELESEPGKGTAVRLAFAAV